METATTTPTPSTTTNTTRSCGAPQCQRTTVPFKRCPKCTEQGLVEGSYFCDTDCFRAAWPEHNKERHKTAKQAPLLLLLLLLLLRNMRKKSMSLTLIRGGTTASALF